MIRCRHRTTAIITSRRQYRSIYYAARQPSAFLSNHTQRYMRKLCSSLRQYLCTRLRLTLTRLLSRVIKTRVLFSRRKFSDSYLRAVGRQVLWSAACVCLSVCVCVRALFLSARYLKNGFMDHHQIWWVGAGGEPLEEV